MSIDTTTFTATPRPRSESAFVVLGAGTGSTKPAYQAPWPVRWSHVATMSVPGAISADIQVNPIFTRDRVVSAAKQGSPPRGAPR